MSRDEVSGAAASGPDESPTADPHIEIARIIRERDIISLYQPIVDLRTGALVGCEVLSRGPEGTPLHTAPELFRAAAEAGLLAELDLTCRILGLRRVAESGIDPGFVFVNVEPGLGRNLSMNEELLTLLGEVPFQVVVEFTERALTNQAAALLRHRDDIHQRGNLVAIDDLGADPHSLALVPLLKPDILKLDLALVQGQSMSAGVTAAAAWEYADRTGAAVVAEGIETEDHRQRAIALGASWGQGWLFARPGPLSELDKMPRSRTDGMRWRGARWQSPSDSAIDEPRQISRLMMLVLSQQLESAARRLGPHGVLVASVQTEDVLTTRLTERYAAIAERAALVGLVGVGVGAEPGPGVRGGDLASDDPLAEQWSVAVVGPHFSAALVGHPDPDMPDCFQAVWSLDPAYAAGVAEDLTRRLLPATTADDATSGSPLTTPITLGDMWSAIAALLDRPGVRAEAIGDDGLFVSAPKGLAELMATGMAGPTALNAVAPESRDDVVATWTRARNRPGGSAGVSVRTIEGEEAWLHFSDLRTDYGVYTGVLIPKASAESLGSGPGDERSASARLPDPVIRQPMPESPRYGWIRKDEQGLILEADTEACAVLGYAASTLDGMRSLELIHPDDRDVALSSWIDMLSSPGITRRVRLRHRRADGSYLWCEVLNHNALSDAGKGYVLSELTDVDAEVVAQQELGHQQRTLRTLAETLAAGVVLIDTDGVVAFANQRMHAMTALAQGDRVEQLVAAMPAASQSLVLDAYRESLSTERPVRISAYLGPAGSDITRLYQIDISPTGDGGVVACAVDVTEETQIHRELEYQATRDALTGAWNRSSLLGMVAEAVEPVLDGKGRRNGDRRLHLSSPVAVLYVDLDGFKEINDRYGHAAGDEMLVRCAGILRSALRDRDDIGRIGGDEFLLICRDVVTADGAQVIAAKLRHALSTDGVAASIGVAWTEVPMDADTLVAVADADMYREKTGRRQTDSVG